MAVIVITGAAGVIGQAVSPQLATRHQLRLLDVQIPEHADSTWTRGSIADSETLAKVLDGADTLVHLAGIPTEAPWEDLLTVNIDGTRRVLEAARDAGVRRVMLASSIHAGGYLTGADADSREVRPDSFYGVSKAAMEALGSLFADRFGMCVVSARICTFGTEPSAGRTVATWLSAADMVGLVEAVANLETPGHHLIWAVSNNSPGWFNLEPGRRVGYHPVDDAAARLEEIAGTPPKLPDSHSVLGGPFLDIPLGRGSTTKR
ncbi:NAD-dependent epimerase/dehydratase family protein [Microbacterium dauci]|uniref:NAD(P)-dependent oxidoreductase n=1 Tax=Microbacterium dauci TaxID=3048008 RepID=A0ABT6ZCC4_9MICO|nr:NAD(P)-dependent oxidoreductase [Microbacterium sp. LX3-4]MDJ1113812.1 NAD(P)-dependent oxidoreductase [Microbacterium sp. LX3-4]